MQDLASALREACDLAMAAGEGAPFGGDSAANERHFARVTKLRELAEPEACPVCSSPCCARMTGRYNDCTDRCGHDFDDGKCFHCHAIERGQLDRFGSIERSTVASPYDSTIRWETDDEMLRRGATQRDLARIGPAKP